MEPRGPLLTHGGGDLLGADLAHRLAHRPLMAERILQDAVPIAPELVLERHHDSGTGIDSLLELSVRPEGSRVIRIGYGRGLSGSNRV